MSDPFEKSKKQIARGESRYGSTTKNGLKDFLKIEKIIDQLEAALDSGSYIKKGRLRETNIQSMLAVLKKNPSAAQIADGERMVKDCK